MNRWISSIGITLGFMAAIAVGILAGIDAAIMFPTKRLLMGLLLGGANSFVSAVSYFYVVSQDNQPSSLSYRHDGVMKNTLISTLFALAACVFILTTFIANYVGMYIGFMVLGGKLDLAVPEILFKAPGIIFGVSSAVSGIIFNVKVATILWNKIRRHDLTSLQIHQPLLLNSASSKRRHLAALQPDVNPQCSPPSSMTFFHSVKNTAQPSPADASSPLLRHRRTRSG